jgi:proton-dependent oligopeptide transporter, POT family
LESVTLIKALEDASPFARHTQVRTGLFGQPKGLLFLFFVEAWERFSFYGMKALLILFLVDEKQWSVSRAATFYGNYTALAYIAPMFGGFVADRFLGLRRSLIWGGVVIALGHFLLAFQHNNSFILGLTLIILGTGLFKPNVSTMVGELYAPGDGRRDGGFTIFFMGISVGAFVAPLVCGYLAQRIGWAYGFAAAGVGMVIGLSLFLSFYKRYLPGIGESSSTTRADAGKSISISVADKRKIWAVILIVVLTIPFWICYEQVGSSLSLFADKHIARTLGSFVIPASWFQSINPIVILIFAPLVTLLWDNLQRRGREPGAPAKMAVAYLLAAIGFAFAARAGYLSERVALVGPLWFFATDLSRSGGELLLSPVGLSEITKIAPKRYGSTLMAAWFLSEGIGNKLAGSLAAYSGIIPAGYFFAIFVAIALASMIAMLGLVPTLKRLTYEP